VARERKTRLRLAREAANVSQVALAERAGIPIATYRRLERGEVRNPSIRLLVNCAIVLFTPIEELLDDEWIEWLPTDRREPPPVEDRLPLVRELEPRTTQPEWTRDPAPAYAKAAAAEAAREKAEEEKQRIESMYGSYVRSTVRRTAGGRKRPKRS
jgi:transcriptional regulator with XRE-family HTH domain